MQGTRRLAGSAQQQLRAIRAALVQARWPKVISADLSKRE
jgi:hypothetical protein